MGTHPLTPPQLQSFLAETDNGRSSVSIAKGQGLIVTTGKITFQKDESFDVTLDLGRPGKALKTKEATPNK